MLPASSIARCASPRSNSGRGKAAERMDDVTEATRGGATTPAVEDFSPTARTTLRRLPKRGSFERETVYGILDEGFICHVGFNVDGQPFVIPTAYGRAGDV